MAKVKTIAVVNGGGDAPGLNAVIRGVARSAIGTHDLRVIGIHNGFDGLKEALEQRKFVDPVSEIVLAARAIGTTFRDGV